MSCRFRHLVFGENPNKEMVSDRHKSIRAIAMFSTREILLAADLNLFMPTVIFCSAIRYFPRYSGSQITAKIAGSGAV